MKLLVKFEYFSVLYNEWMNSAFNTETDKLFGFLKLTTDKSVYRNIVIEVL